MVEVKLLSWSQGLVRDPRRLVLLAIKISAGKVKLKGLEHYLSEYPESKLGSWVAEAWRFPSVLEHVVFSFYIEGISRVTSHQLVRHRLASYTQESQRYSAAEASVVVPKTVERGEKARRIFEEVVAQSMDAYEKLLSLGIPYEDARYVLPQAIKTRLLMTVNLRELIHIACLRLSKDAQWEIREVVKRMVEEASKVVPEVTQLIERMCKSEEGGKA